LIGVAPLVAAARLAIPSVLTLHDYWYLCPRHTLQRNDGSLCEEIPVDPSACAWCYFAEGQRYLRVNQLSGGLFGRIARGVALKPQTALIGNRRASLAYALTLPRAVIAPSKFLASRFVAFVGQDRLYVSRYGLDLGPFQQLHRRTRDRHNLKIGYIGQIARHKGVHLLIEAFRKLYVSDMPVELHVHGGLEANPGYVSELRQLAGDDPHIHFHGRFENSRVAEVLATFDVSVVPSIWYENCPLAILEAHAAGVPVITASLGGMAELVCDVEDGLHFKPKDAQDLARQLQRLIDQPNLLEQLWSGVRAPRDIDDEMRYLMGIYDSIVIRS
jgi:glycosyltransferase involved in cell wall biosynthesis